MATVVRVDPDDYDLPGDMFLSVVVSGTSVGAANCGTTPKAYPTASDISPPSSGGGTYSYPIGG